MKLAERLRELVRARFTGIYICSPDHDDALDEIASLCRGECWALATWDVERGLDPHDNWGDGVISPLAPIRALGDLALDDGTVVLVLRNFHRFLGSTAVVQALDARLYDGRHARTFVVILAPVVQLPVELERQFVVIDHDPPGRGQLEALARARATGPGELPGEDDLDAVLDAAAGLTRTEAENALRLSLVRHGRLVPEVIREVKLQSLRKCGFLEIDQGTETLAGLGGMEAMKAFCLRALRDGSRRTDPRGILILGVPGTGKSQFARRLGNDVGRPTLVVDLGRLKGGLVGDTERRTRQALRLLSATSRNVAFFDEIEKMTAGVQGSGRADGGISAGQLAALLSHMDAHAGETFFIFTANDVTKLPPELTRAERIDATFFVDFPGPAQRRAIWNLHLRASSLDPSQRTPPDRDWTGAEIGACCRLAALLDVPLPDAARQIVPVAVSAREPIERLRRWADGRCLSADRPGVYMHQAVPLGLPGPAFNHGDPSVN